MYDDIRSVVGDGFDAVICLGNSFAHMLDSFGDQRDQKRAIKNFEQCVKPGGLLLIDHRNYDNIMSTGSTPSKSLYYNVSVVLLVFRWWQYCIETNNKFSSILVQSSSMTDIKTSVLYVNAAPALVTLDYLIKTTDAETSEFRLSYYPHKLDVFTDMLRTIFGERAEHRIFGDFKTLDVEPTPAFYIHVVAKK